MIVSLSQDLCAFRNVLAWLALRQKQDTDYIRKLILWHAGQQFLHRARDFSIQPEER